MQRRIVIIRIALATLIILGLFKAVHSLSRSTRMQAFGEIVDRVETERKVIALTLDDGPTVTGTEAVLRILARHDVPATFFVLGRYMDQNPGSARAIVAAGHELGNHSWSHRAMMFRSPGFIREELARTDGAIRAAGHVGPIHFRPPFGRKFLVLPWILARQDRLTVTWSVAPETFQPDQTKDEIVAAVLEQTHPGSILLLHPMYDSNEAARQALPEIIAGLKSRGYDFVRLSDLLEMR